MLENSLLKVGPTSNDPAEIRRRNFLRWVAVSTGGVVASQFTACGGGSDMTSESATALAEPTVLRSSNGIVSLDLIAEYKSQKVTLVMADNSNA